MDVLAATRLYEFLRTDRQRTCMGHTLGNNAFPDVRNIAHRKPITLPLTRNRELTGADVQYTRPSNIRQENFIRKEKGIAR